MGDNHWWFNNAGKAAPISNPGSKTPNYGLTYDLTTAPYDTPDQFDALAAVFGQQASQAVASYVPTQMDLPQHKSIWDHVTGAAGAIGSGIESGIGWTGEHVVDPLMLTGHDDSNPGKLTAAKAEADRQGLTGDARAKFIGKAALGEDMQALSNTHGTKELFWGLEKANEYASTAFVAATLSEDDTGKFFKSGTWGDAHALTKDYRLNAGEAFAQMFYDKEVLLDKDRFEQIRQHNTVFNVGALAFNVIAAWKADPNVIFGKGLGAARGLSRGKLAINGRTAEVQRDILSQPSMDEAKAAAGNYSTLPDKLRASHAVSLYDRSQQLRAAAQEMPFGQFKKLPAFKPAASGVALAKLMKDVAPDDAAWNLVFRSSIGDPNAVGELLAQHAWVADKINAIEMRDLPPLQAELDRMETRYQKRLAEQGRPQDAAIEITRFGDKWLEDEVTSLRAEADALSQRLAAYDDHESWLQRALPGVTDPAEPDLAAMRTAPNAIFNSLDVLGGKGIVRRSLPSLGGAVKMWQHDEFSPTSWIFRAPTKPNLKRVGLVSLHDVEDGGEAVTNYLNQLDYIRKGKSPVYRDKVLEAWAGARTDVERRDVMQKFEREAVSAVGEKHGLSAELMDKLGQELQTKRGQSWGKFSDTQMYSPIPGKAGPGYVEVDGARVKMPVHPSQLPNYYPLTNLTDLDRLIRLHADDLRAMDTELASMKKAGIAWTERHTREVLDSFGTWFNSIWKPMALLSIRWPARVVADETTRVMLAAGVLPQLANIPVGVRNILYNNGVVRPYEWWAGRGVRTGSVAEDSLRAGTRNDFDAYDYRAITNPTAVVPEHALDFGKLDPKRYEKLNVTTSKRWDYLRKLEAHRANTRVAKKVSPEMGDAVAAFTKPERPAWATQWDQRLNEAAKSDSRGFFFDPITRKSSNKGFAVSVYPGRLRTFERKPTARELNYWTEKNSDLLAIPNSRVAVWLDKDTGRWHLDIVKTTRDKADAMALASRAEATEFYDITDGFTRYMSEDFWGHFQSPFFKPKPGGPDLAFDQAPVAEAADAADAAIGSAAQAPRLAKKRVGFGTKTWRTRDGKKIETQEVFGPDAENPNIYYGVTSSRSAIQNLFAGHTRALQRHRANGFGDDYRVFDPDNEKGTVDEWAKAWSYYVNNHLRYDDLIQKMMAGESDDKIFDWLMGTAKGRQLRKRMGSRGENPHTWVDSEREIFDHMFPTEQSLEAARLGEVDPKRVPELIPEGMRPTVHGDSIKLALGQHAHRRMWDRFIDSSMNALGTVPTDALVRHPYAKTIYNREMRNYLASVPADKITNHVLAAAEASARAKAVKSVRKVLYNIADEREAVHALRFISPFFQAQVEVLEKYAHLIMEKPESIARLAQLFQGSQVLNTGLWQVVDENGKPAKGYSQNNQVIFQATSPLVRLINNTPGLKGTLDNAGDVTIPVASLNLILQGDTPYLPSLGPLVTYPADELVFKDRPQLDGSAIYHWLYPFGEPRGSNMAERFFNSMAPAYARRGVVWGTGDMSDPAFGRRVAEIGAQQMYEWERTGRDGPRPTEQQAVEAAKNEYRLRAASSFFFPAPLTPRSPFQHWIDMYRSYQERFGEKANEKFYDAVGPDYYMFAQQATQSTGGMSPDVGSKKAYDRYKSLAQRAPDLIGVLTGPFATGQFSDAVYQWQLRTPVSPASSETLRHRLSPSERISESEISRGWVEYGKLASAIDAEIRNRVAQGGSPYLTASANADLQAIKAEKIREIIDRNPAWNDAYNSRNAHLGEWLGQAYDVAFSHELDGRSDIEALRAYLIGRARLQDTLRQREDSGLSSSDQFSFDPLGNPVGDNADLAVAWTSWVNELTGKNPLFADIYNRYLEGDDLSTYVPPGVSNVAGVH